MNLAPEMDRRKFVTGALLAGAAAMGLTACSPSSGASEATGTDDASTTEGKPEPSDRPSWLGEPPAITDAECKETIDTEVLVIGAGCSGLVAANFAAMEGARTLLIEKYDVGTGLRGSAIGGVGTKKQKEANVPGDLHRFGPLLAEQLVLRPASPLDRSFR